MQYPTKLTQDAANLPNWISTTLRVKAGLYILIAVASFNRRETGTITETQASERAAGHRVRKVGHAVPPTGHRTRTRVNKNEYYCQHVGQ